MAVFRQPLQNPVNVRPFEGRLVIQLSEVPIFDDDGTECISYFAPDVAYQWGKSFGNGLWRYVRLSSVADAFRPLKSSLRAAQIKSNASLPSRSPHNFGASFDLALERCRTIWSAASRVVAAGHGDDLDKRLVQTLTICAPVGWKPGMSVSDHHIRLAMTAFGFVPHRDTVREAWHVNGVRFGDSNGRGEILMRYPGLEVPDLKVLQRMLTAIDDPQTGKPYYLDKYGNPGSPDGKWGPQSKAAWNAFMEDWRFAFFRKVGVAEWARAKLGLTPGSYGRNLIALMTADFRLVEPREKF